ncbi:MAG: amidohydrolase family protein [Candidatus Thermoplasmatota archaeon]|jgi:adenine deaminase|nr:amidohydrolase family protein [Candidatus Thermoplasmatota archaeon]
MKILIREGSAARNFDELKFLLNDQWQNCMLCSDDKHPDDLLKGHINLMVKKAIHEKIDLFNVLSATSLNPKNHYNLDIGLLRIGDPADFIIVDNLKDLNVLKTYINGIEVANNGRTLIRSIKPDIKNNFNITPKKPSDFKVKYKKGKLNVIVAIEGQLITDISKEEPLISNGNVVSDVDRDILKITVINRYKESKPLL